MHAFETSNEVQDYINKNFVREPEILRKLREENSHIENFEMIASPDQGQLLSFLVRLIAAESALDIGTYIGYSALSIALSLPKKGRVITCELNKEYSKIAKKYWAIAGVERKIELRSGPALETIDILLQENDTNLFDFAFIDGDKENYPKYYDKVFSLLKVGGIIAIDNVMWCDRVRDTFDNDTTTIGIRKLNSILLKDDRIQFCMLPFRDGISVVQKLKN